jgi:ATP-dependent DNA helicase RecG
MANRLNITEDQHTEFKLSFQEKVIETLAAFANTSGGTVYVGVGDDGEIAGIETGKETIQKWLNDIKLKTQPSIIPTVSQHTSHDKTYVKIQVQEFPIKPVSYRGRYYKRINNSNHQLTPLEISELNMQTLQVSWDSYPALNATLEDIDWNKVRNFIGKVNKTGRFQLPDNLEDSLKKLKLINNLKVSNAALLLFAKEDIIYNVHLGRFKTPSLIIDDRVLRLSLFEAVEETIKYLVSHIKFAFEITGKTTQRTEIPEYPLEALRELVLNAFIHRDYLSPADVQIKIFDNYITFFNPGNLPENLSIHDLMTDSYPAYARNKLLAEAFYLSGDIEKYGSGFIRIRKALQQYPTMKMELKEVGGGFMVTISYNKQKTSKENITENVTENVTDNVTGNVTENRADKIIELIRKNPFITTEEMSRILKVSKRTVLRDMDQLKKEKRVTYEGPSKGGQWIVI